MEQPQDDGAPSGKEKAIDHFLWVISRLALILLTFSAAYLLQVPIRELVQKNILEEYEKREHETTFKKVDLVKALDISATKFYISFLDSTEFITIYIVKRAPENQEQVILQIQANKNLIDKLREQFANRPDVLDTELEDSIRSFIKTGSRGISTQEEALNSSLQDKITNILGGQIGQLEKYLAVIKSYKTKYTGDIQKSLD